MDELAERASFQSPYDNFVKGFATQEVNFTSSQRIYELVQCTPDLAEDDCNTCLRFAIHTLSNCCTGQRGARVLLPACNVRYEVNYPFYGAAATALAPRVPLLVPSSPPPSSLTRSRARGKVTKLLLAQDFVSIVIIF